MKNKKIELHCKTKYSSDFDSTIDIESVIYNAKENGERGIVFVDKDSILAFPKIEKIYNKLCLKDKSFKDFKIGYGVELTTVINNKEYEIVILLKNNKGLLDIHKIMSLYLCEYDKRIPINEIINNDNLLVGLILDENSIKLDLSIFDYLEINNNIDISNIKDKNKIIYSNIPNSLFLGEVMAKEVLYSYKKIDKFPECRLYKDTEDILKIFNDKEIVINNSNNIFDKLDFININDEKFHIVHSDFSKFEKIVRDKFNNKYKNPSSDLITRVEQELNLIKELDYTYYYELLIKLINYLKEKDEYYQLDGYINNSIVSYILGITEIEPFNLPYELFFSETPKIQFKLSPEFYYKKMFPFILETFKDNLIKCGYSFKLNKTNIPRIIKNYEIKNKKEFLSNDKDYITDVLSDIPLYKKECINTSFLIIPDNIFKYTAYEYYMDSIITNYDYHDIENNLIKLEFILNEDILLINNLIKKTNKKIELCNDKRVYNLFRNTEEFNTKFKILNRDTGLLNIRYFDSKELESKLINISNIWSDDLIKILLSVNHGIVKDDLYNNLKERGLDDKDIFNTINYLNEIKLLIPKSFMINKIRISYMEMYYKLYYSKEYYYEMLSGIDYKYIDKKVYKYNIDNITKRYYELTREDKHNIPLDEYEELKLLEILIEMYERGIKYKIKNNKIEVI